MQNRTQPPLIVQDTLSTPANANMWPRLLKLFAGDVSADSVMESAENKKKEKKEKKKKKPKTKEAKTFNVFESEPDFESPNGRTITINTKDLKVLSGSTVGVFMVNLTQGSMMGPHWNPWACEISIVLKGSGMVRVLRNSVSKSSSECENSRFKVEEGDIFAVPRLHPMAQMSFISDSLVFVGFTTSAKNNEPQFLAGKTSALRLLDREVLAASFNVSTVMIDGLLGAQKEAVVLGCSFCAEGELKRLESEKAKKEEEERKKREEEEEKQWPPQPQPQQPPQPFQPEQPGEGPQEPQQPGGGPQEPQRPGEGPQEPQQPGEGPKEPQQPGGRPQEPQQPGGGPQEPQQPGGGPQEPQQPGEGPKEPQQPGGGPQEPQQPGGGPQEPAQPKTEAEKRDAERKREEEQAKKEEEERLWPSQPQ